MLTQQILCVNARAHKHTYTHKHTHTNTQSVLVLPEEAVANEASKRINTGQKIINMHMNRALECVMMLIQEDAEHLRESADSKGCRPRSRTDAFSTILMVPERFGSISID